MDNLREDCGNMLAKLSEALEALIALSSTHDAAAWQALSRYMGACRLCLLKTAFLPACTTPQLCVPGNLRYACTQLRGLTQRQALDMCIMHA